MDELFRHWDLFKTFNRRERNEIARMYGFNERPGS